jgi:hypothetical protein
MIEGLPLFGKKGPSHHILRKQNLRLPYLDIRFQYVTQNVEGIPKKSTFLSNM